MKTYLGKMQKGLVMSIAVWATACSNVSFTPSGENGKLETPDGSQKETFSFDDDGSGALVDVLFVVDNSGSMYDEQMKLGTALSSFITSLGKIDWQIGVTTTDISNGPYGIKGSLLPMHGLGAKKVLKKGTPGFEAVFKNTVVRPELLNCDPNDVNKPCPSSDERPLQALSMAFAKANSDNAGFFRDGAELAVVVLSDEDEGSNGMNAMTAAAVQAAFLAVFGTGKPFTTYAIVIEPGDTNCFNSQPNLAGQYGNFISSLALLTGGVTGSICDADYGSTLEAIGDRVRERVKSISLKYTPNPDTVQIVITPFDSSLTWVISGNSINFNKPPKKGTKVEVVYLPEQATQP